MSNDRLVMTSHDLERYPDPVLERIKQWSYEHIGRLFSAVDHNVPQKPLYMEIEVDGAKSRYVFTGEVSSNMRAGDPAVYESVWHRLPVEP